MNMKDFKLDNENKITSGFTVPDGYFESFSEKVLAQLPKKEPKTIALFGYRKVWYYAAAAAVAITISIPVYNKYASRQDEIDSAALEHYIAYNSSISEDDIINLLNQEDIDKMKFELKVDDKEIEDALKSNSNLEEYLID